MVKTLDPLASAESASVLCTYPCVGDEAPESFAWLTDNGVLYGCVDTAQRDAFKIMHNDKLYRSVVVYSLLIHCF